MARLDTGRRYPGIQRPARYAERSSRSSHVAATLGKSIALRDDEAVDPSSSQRHSRGTQTKCAAPITKPIDAYERLCDLTPNHSQVEVKEMRAELHHRPMRLHIPAPHSLRNENDLEPCYFLALGRFERCKRLEPLALRSPATLADLSVAEASFEASRATAPCPRKDRPCETEKRRHQADCTVLLRSFMSLASVPSAAGIEHSDGV